MDSDCLDRNDDLITAALEAHAAGRVEDSFKYLERLHKDIVEIGSFIDRADERSLLEGLKYGAKKKRVETTTAKTTDSLRGLNIPSTTHMMVGGPMLALPPHLTNVQPLKTGGDGRLVSNHPKIKITKPFIPVNSILAVCAECKQKKKGKTFCRQDLKHTAPPWNADQPQKDKKKKTKPSSERISSVLETQMQMFRASQLGFSMTMPYNTLLPDDGEEEVECDEFSDEDL